MHLFRRSSRKTLHSPSSLALQWLCCTTVEAHSRLRCTLHVPHHNVVGADGSSVVAEEGASSAVPRSRHGQVALLCHLPHIPRVAVVLLWLVVIILSSRCGPGQSLFLHLTSVLVVEVFDPPADPHCDVFAGLRARGREVACHHQHAHRCDPQSRRSTSALE